MKINSKWRWRKITNFLPIIVVLLFSISCSSGSSSNSGDVSGLEIANQMSLVDTSTSVSASSSGFALALRDALHADVSELPEDSDYVSDANHVDRYTYDESMEFLDMVNEILCMLNQTHYSDFLNEGPYMALVDSESCMKDKSNQASNQSSSEAIELESWVIDSSRASNDDPQIVKFWIDLPSEELIIYAQLTITGEKSDSNPFGEFRLDAKQLTYTGETSFEIALLVAENAEGQIGMEMKMSSDENEVNFERNVNAVFQPSTTAGVGLDNGVAHIESSMEGNSGGEGGGGSQLGTIDIAFSSSRYLANIASEEENTTLCKDRENFTSNAFSYNLYNAETGDRVSLNGGMQIHPENGSQHDWCWASRWGVWCPDNIDVENGLVFTDKDGAEFTLFESPFRVMRHERNTITLDELAGKPLRMWDQSEQTTVIMEWNSDQVSFIINATENCDQNGCNPEEIEPTPLEINPSQWYSMWANDLGSIDFVAPENGLLNNEFTVNYVTQESVLPGDDVFADGDLNLNCFDSCPATEISADDWEFGFVTLNSSFDIESPHVYTVDSETLEVTSGGEVACLADGEIPTENAGSYWWGFHSSGMVTEDVLSLMELTWDIYSQDVSYSIECGPNNWNKTMILLDANGDRVVFDDPVQCRFDHEDYGLAFLNYEGEGNLHGIPWVSEQSENTDFQYWHPLYSLDDGTELDCDENGTLVTRAMILEQKLNSLDVEQCSDLDLATLEASDLTFVTPDIGEKPAISEAPLVISGVIQ